MAYSSNTLDLHQQLIQKLKVRLSVVSGRMDIISRRLADENNTLSPSGYNSLVSEFRVLARNYEIAENELKEMK